MISFKIVIVGGPVEKYIERCIRSVLSQDYTNWTTCIVLDPVGDRSSEIAESFSGDSRIKIIKNSKQMYALPNIIKSILEQNPKDEDVISTLDADDWFSGPNTLSIVKNQYLSNPGLLLTHGSWVSYPDIMSSTNCWPYTQNDFNIGVRNVAWRATHLRTFKYKLWKNLRDVDLKDPNGQYFKSAWDLAMMLPMVEMAGIKRIKFIPEKIYTYNQETPYNDGKLRLEEQRSNAIYISSKRPYAYKENFF